MRAYKHKKIILLVFNNNLYMILEFGVSFSGPVFSGDPPDRLIVKGWTSSLRAINAHVIIVKLLHCHVVL